MSRSPARYGFTLVEIMVATVIFMLFITAVYGTYTAAHSAMTRAEEQEELYQTGRVVLAQLNSELTCTYQAGTATVSALTSNTKRIARRRYKTRMSFSSKAANHS
jgi:prepilin-type N-terminal cleavage/methylation domain-containing protein